MRPFIPGIAIGIGIFIGIQVIFPGATAFAQTPGKTTLESVTGAPKLKLLRNGSEAELSAGATLETGDRIKTPKEVSAVVLYADGSRIEVKPESDFQVEQMVGETQWNRLREGKVRGTITKPAELKEAVGKKPRFMIRSKTAVMGVRGTEFVMALEKGAKATVHTLEGIVEVARSEEALLSGNGTPVEAGKMVQATSSGISPPQAFDSGEFLKTLQGGSDAAASSSGGTGAAAAGAAKAASGAGPSVPGASAPEALSAPSFGLPPAPQLNRPEEQKQIDMAEQKKQEESRRKIRIAAFRIAPLFVQPPYGDPIRILTVGWTPTVPIPVLKFLSARGYAGGGFFRGGAINSTFVMHEYHAIASVTLFDNLMAEASFGWQFWRSEGVSGRVASANVGYVFGPNALINHVFVGKSLFESKPLVQEFRAGVGIVLF